MSDYRVRLGHDIRLAVLQENMADVEVGGELSYRAAMSLLRGQVYEAQENRIQAVRWYRDALRTDPFCYEAFKASPSCITLAAQNSRRLVLSHWWRVAIGPKLGALLGCVMLSSCARMFFSRAL